MINKLQWQQDYDEKSQADHLFYFTYTMEEHKQFFFYNKSQTEFKQLCMNTIMMQAMQK